MTAAEKKWQRDSVELGNHHWCRIPGVDKKLMDGKHIQGTKRRLRF
jgi:hypothetical protein